MKRICSKKKDGGEGEGEGEDLRVGPFGGL